MFTVCELDTHDRAHGKVGECGSIEADAAGGEDDRERRARRSHASRYGAAHVSLNPIRFGAAQNIALPAVNQRRSSPYFSIFL